MKSKHTYFRRKILKFFLNRAIVIKTARQLQNFTANDCMVRANYVLVKLITECGKLFTDGKFFNKMCQDIVKQICPEQESQHSEVSFSARIIRRIFLIWEMIF